MLFILAINIAQFGTNWPELIVVYTLTRNINRVHEGIKKLLLKRQPREL